MRSPSGWVAGRGCSAAVAGLRLSSAWLAQPGEPGTGGTLASNALEVYVHRLRRKLAGSAFGIRNIRGLGYMLDAADS